MKFNGYKLMTDLGAGLFLLLIKFGVPETIVKAIAQRLSTKFFKERDMREGSAIRPTWAKIYMLGLPILALVLLVKNVDFFTVIDAVVLFVFALGAVVLSYGYGSFKRLMSILAEKIGTAQIKLPESDPVRPSTYSADTPPPRNTSTAD